jgi:hypothetical protein
MMIEWYEDVIANRRSLGTHEGVPLVGTQRSMPIANTLRLQNTYFIKSAIA